MRISDWSSDVCSSDLANMPAAAPAAPFANSRLVIAFTSFLLNWSLGIDAAIIACIEAEIARASDEFRYFGIGAHQHRTGRGNHRIRGRTPGQDRQSTRLNSSH